MQWSLEAGWWCCGGFGAAAQRAQRGNDYGGATVLGSGGGASGVRSEAVRLATHDKGGGGTVVQVQCFIGRGALRCGRAHQGGAAAVPGKSSGAIRVRQVGR